MFRNREQIREWLTGVVEKFRQKGATSPDKAMTAEELGLPSGFQEAMKRRLGRSGIFVEVNGKYYLSEERLKQIEEMRNRGNGAGGAQWGPRRNMVKLRIIRMVTAVLIVTLLLINIFVQSWEIRVLSAVIVVVWIAITILQIYFLSRARRRFSPPP